MIAAKGLNSLLLSQKEETYYKKKVETKNYKKKLAKKTFLIRFYRISTTMLLHALTNTYMNVLTYINSNTGHP